MRLLLPPSNQCLQHDYQIFHLATSRWLLAISELYECRHKIIAFTRGINNKYPWLHFAIPCAIWAKLHSLPFPRISPNTTRLRLVVFGLILGNGNSCNFARYPTRFASLNVWHPLWGISKIPLGPISNLPFWDLKSVLGVFFPNFPGAQFRQGYF